MNATPTTTDVTGYGSFAELPASVRSDALILIETDPAVFYGAWTVEGGYAISSRDVYGGDPCWLAVVGTAQAGRALTAVALKELGGQCCGIAASRDLDISEWVGQGAPSRWDLMCCEAEPPRQPGEERVERAKDLAAVQSFLERVNPNHSVRVQHPEVEHWLGIADEASGALLSVGAFSRRPHGTAYLASIATAPEARGQGLGGAVTAALTRHAFASGDSLCTLAHYHPNEQARRLYLRLGYRTTHQMQSGIFSAEQRERHERIAAR